MIICKGVTTPMTIDLSSIDFTGVEKIVLTIKNRTTEEPVVIREFTEPKVYVDKITPEEAHKIHYGALYDFDAVMASTGERNKITRNYDIKLVEGVGSVYDTTD